MNEIVTGREREAERLRILGSYPFGDEDVQRQLDRIARLAAQICETPMALVSLVDLAQQVFVGKSGTDLDDTPRDFSFCTHAMHFPEGMEIADATRDPRFRDNPLVTGEPGIRFYAGQPLISPEGVPLGSLCVIDTSPRTGLDEQQQDALATLSLAAMALLDRKRVEKSRKALEVISRNEIDDLEQRFLVLADAMPQLVWSTNADGHADYFNQGWCDYTGASAEASYGASWIDFLHPDDREVTERCWRDAVENSGFYEVEYRLRGDDGEFRWFLARGLPMTDANGAVRRWMGTCTYIHDQKETAEQLETLSRELNHRIKNIFAVIGGLIGLTVRKAPEYADLARELQDRVLALGRAHDFVRSHSATEISSTLHSSLRGMLEVLIAPYRQNGTDRIAVTGDDIAIDDRSATPLALFFHELATNAVKYGALSQEEGSVEIGIRQGDTVELAWTETGGPTVTGQSHQGFGATLIEMSVGRQLGGELAYDWRPEGLCVTARIPHRAMSR